MYVYMHWYLHRYMYVYVYVNVHVYVYVYTYLLGVYLHIYIYVCVRAFVDCSFISNSKALGGSCSFQTLKSLEKGTEHQIKNLKMQGDLVWLQVEVE